MATTASKKTDDAPAATETVKPVVAVHRINGTILPGTMFRPTAAQLVELEELKAVRDLNEAEAALFEKTEKRPSDDEIA